MPKLIRVGQTVASPHMAELSATVLFLISNSLLGHAHSRRRALDPHVLYINRRSVAQGCAFWGFHHHDTSHGRIFPKTLNFGVGNRGFQLESFPLYVGNKVTNYNA
jgi:hypothetical protein